MIKRILKYLLSICIVLLGGFNLLSAHATNDTLVFSDLIEYQQTQKLLVVSNPHEVVTQISPISTSNEKRAIKKIDVTENEVEEDELSPEKKCYEDSIAFSLISFKFLYHSVIKHIPSFQRSYYTPFKSHVFLGTFRL